MGWPDAGDLLAGPRGRRLCWSLLDAGDGAGWIRVWTGAQAGDLTGMLGELGDCVAHTDLDATVRQASELALLAAFAEPVGRATYWQQPDGVDVALTDPAVRDVLAPVAGAVTAAPAARWWPDPVAGDRQQYAEWIDEHDFAPRLTGAAVELAAWQDAAAQDEQSARDRPDDPAAPWSGYWWSAPLLSRLPSTTRSVAGLGAVRLALVEDSYGWREARCWPVAPRPGARVYEIAGPGQWTDLVGRYPLDVSRSRRHDWWRVTGWAGRWLIPDFAAVAADYDAVHLSAAAYLTTAGRALAVGGARTMLAGWDPDQTYWLTDSLTLTGLPVTWSKTDEGQPGWIPASSQDVT
jgi:hypothetical protein